MKKSIIAVLVIVLVGVIYSVNSGNVSNHAKSIFITVADTSTALPDSVSMIVQKCCMDCHSDNGGGMPKAKLNFSQWSKYSPEKRMNKAEDICSVMSKASMPPSRYCRENPGNVPTQSQVKIVCRWANKIANSVK